MLDTLASLGIKFENRAIALRFMDMYGFTEDDITFDALTKSYYRYRKAEGVAKERQNAALNIPNCPAAEALPLAA